jgi:hypothetical protein
VRCRILIDPFKFKFDHLNTNLAIFNVQKNYKNLKNLNLVPHPLINTFEVQKILKKLKLVVYFMYHI